MNTIKSFFKCVLCIALMVVFLNFPAPRYVRVNFTESDDAFVNPFKGFVAWAINQTPQNAPDPDFSLAFALLHWSEFESQEGVYDFEAFEKRNNFEHLREHNVKIVFRFVSDYPTKEEHMDIPQWLYDATRGAGDFYDNDGLRGFAPDYTNPVFIEHHRLAVKAIAERYDNSQDVAFVQLGSIGQWGEWHNAISRKTPFPEPDVTDVYIDHYLASFKNTFLQMRRPFEMMRDNDIGLYNDMMGHKDSTYTWLDWLSEAKISDFYKRVPSGGEFASTNTLEEYFGKMYNDVKTMIQDCHTTYVGGYPPETGEGRKNGDDLLKTLGYRFTVKSALFEDTLSSGDPMYIAMDVENVGIAPFYYGWGFRLVFFDAEGKPAYTRDPLWDAREIMPGEVFGYQADLPPMDPGKYTLKLGLFNPATQKAEVHLANGGTDNDLLLTIGTVDVN